MSGRPRFSVCVQLLDGHANDVEIFVAPRLPQPREHVDVKRAVWRDILDCGVLTEQVVRRDLVDVWVIEDRAESPLQPLDIVAIRGDEQIEILGEAGEPVKVERGRAEYDVSNILALERSEHTL